MAVIMKLHVLVVSTVKAMVFQLQQVNAQLDITAQEVHQLRISGIVLQVIFAVLDLEFLNLAHLVIIV